MPRVWVVCEIRHHLNGVDEKGLFHESIIH